MQNRTTKKISRHIKQRFGKMAESMEDYPHHLDFRLLENFGDDALAFILAKVKGVNMLDLNETDITNESIKMLTRLEYLYELRLKECGRLDNECVEYLNQLTSLTFLHLKSTGITIDGLLQLTNLINLKELNFSAEDIESILEKMLQLQMQLPGCSFIVNSKPWPFMEGIR